MSQNTSSPEELACVNRAADIFLGVTMVICFVVGCCGNILSLWYFSTRPCRNNNTKFFNRAYQCLAVVDTIICFLAIVPIITLFSQNRSFIDQLQASNSGKSIYLFIFMTAYIGGPIATAMLGVGRLILLCRPQFQLIPKAPLVLAVANSLLSLFIHIIVVVINRVKVVCKKKDLSCQFMEVVPGRDTAEYRTKSLAWFDLVGWRIFEVLQMGIPIPVVFVTCIASVVFMKLQAGKQGKSQKKFRSASITIILVTGIFAVTYVPQFVGYCYCVAFLIAFAVSPSNTAAEYERLMSEHSIGMKECYDIGVLVTVALTVNSFANPVIFLVRMRSFRMFVAGRGEHTVSTKVSSRAELRHTIENPSAVCESKAG